MTESALALDWVFGFSCHSSQCCHSLYDGVSQTIFYTAAHIGIVFDVATNRQHMLLGHTRFISCSAVTPDKRFIATGDLGTDGLLVVWDSRAHVPVQTLFEPHVTGCASLGFTNDGDYLVSLSAPDGEGAQELAVWDWRESSEAVCRCPVKMKEVADKVRVGADECIVLGATGVLFFSFDPEKATIGLSGGQEPLLRVSEFPVAPGALTDGLFVPDGAGLALTSTVDGDVVEWALSDTGARVARRVLRLHENSAITRLAFACPFIVIGTEDGCVKFFDTEKRLVAWFEEMEAGAILNISCHGPGHPHAPPLSFADPLAQDIIDQLATGGSLPEVDIPDFIVGTSSALIVGMDGSAFRDGDDEFLKGTIFVEGCPAAVPCVAAHPTLSRVAVCCHNGSVYLYDGIEHRIISRHEFQQAVPHSATFTADGSQLIIGFTNGTIRIFPHDDLSEPKQSVGFPKGAVLKIMCSSDSSHMAIVDDQRCITVMRRSTIENESCDVPESEESDVLLEPLDEELSNLSDSVESQTRKREANVAYHWEFLGNYIAHTADITAAHITVDSRERVRLFTLGFDRCLMQFDLGASTIQSGLKLRQRTRLEQDCFPTACCFIARPGTGGRRDIFITAATNYKLRIVNPRTHAITKTVLGPADDLPLSQLLPYAPPIAEEPPVYIAFSTPERLIGLIRLPLDGNPYRYTSVLAHPWEVSSLCVLPDYKLMASAGGEDCAVCFWRVDGRTLDKQIVRGGEGIAPFLEMLDQDMALRQFIPTDLHGKDVEAGVAPGDDPVDFVKALFTFMRLQAESSEEEPTPGNSSDVTGPILRSQVGELCAALGFFPSEHDLALIDHEITYGLSGEEADWVDLETFIKIFLNHRPVQQFSVTDLKRVFEGMGAQSHDETKESVVTLDSLIHHLQENGDAIDLAELNEVAQVLVGSNLRKAFPSTLVSAEDLLEFLGFVTEDTDVSPHTESAADER